MENNGVWRTKALMFLKRGKIEPRLLLRTNTKSHIRFRLVIKSTTLDDLVLCGHRLCDSAIQTIYRTAVVAKLTNAYSAWIVFPGQTTAKRS